MKRLVLKSFNLNQRLKTLVTSLTAGLLLILAQSSAFADRNFSKFDIVLNKSSGAVNVEGLKTKNYLQELAKTRFVYLDLKVLLDGTDEDAVLQSTEEADRRTPVDCQKGRFGPLPMVEGMEYFLATSYEGKRVTATFYPGTRAQHTFNDVACTFDIRIKKRAVFHLRGFFAVVSNTYEDSVSFQLRPVAPTGKEIAKVLK
ncbi:MAG: hypothetical protein JJ964_12765 [Rhizobiales bacterium]|nr:hypothetical protein [Hyphomicrobiales bacterium]